MSSLRLWAKSGGGKGYSMGGRRCGGQGSLRGGMVRAPGASRGGARGGGVTCAMRGGGEMAQEGKSRAAGLAGVENRGGGGGVPWREGEGRPQVEEWDQGEPEKLIGMLSSGKSSRWTRKTGGVAAPPVLRERWR